MVKQGRGDEQNVRFGGAAVRLARSFFFLNEAWCYDNSSFFALFLSVVSRFYPIDAALPFLGRRHARTLFFLTCLATDSQVLRVRIVAQNAYFIVVLSSGCAPGSSIAYRQTQVESQGCGTY